jgi:hypothetical protein
MPRFFFHLSDGTTLRDEEGENCQDAAAARVHAHKVARELAQGDAFRGLVLKVTDEQGTELTRVAIGK